MLNIAPSENNDRKQCFKFSYCDAVIKYFLYNGELLCYNFDLIITRHVAKLRDLLLSDFHKTLLKMKKIVFRDPRNPKFSGGACLETTHK